MENYFLKSGKSENYTKNFLKYANSFGRDSKCGGAKYSYRTKAGKVDPANNGFTYEDLFLISTEKTMEAAGRYAAEGNQTKENLIHLNEGEIVGEWRDSTYGKHTFFCFDESCLF